MYTLLPFLLEIESHSAFLKKIYHLSQSNDIDPHMRVGSIVFFNSGADDLLSRTMNGAMWRSYVDIAKKQGGLDGRLGIVTQCVTPSFDGQPSWLRVSSFVEYADPLKIWELGSVSIDASYVTTVPISFYHSSVTMLTRVASSPSIFEMKDELKLC